MTPSLSPAPLSRRRRAVCSLAAPLRARTPCCEKDKVHAAPSRGRFPQQSTQPASSTIPPFVPKSSPQTLTSFLAGTAGVDDAFAERALGSGRGLARRPSYTSANLSAWREKKSPYRRDVVDWATVR